MSFSVRDRTRYRSQPPPTLRRTFRLDAGTRCSLSPSAANTHCRCRRPLPPVFERPPIAAQRPPPAKEPPGYSIPQSAQTIGLVLLWLLAIAPVCQEVARGYQDSGSDVFRIAACSGQHEGINF